MLGGTLRVTSQVALSHATFQWYRISQGSTGAEEPIAGATRHQYAPEPLDVGQMLVCSVVGTPGEPAVMLLAPAAVRNLEGLDASLQVLRAKPSAEFNVVVVQRNGEMQDRREVHQLEILPNKVKLKRAGKTKYKEDYSPAMQVCGARGGGDAAAQGLFLAFGPQLVFMLVRNAASFHSLSFTFRSSSVPAPAGAFWQLCAVCSDQQECSHTSAQTRDEALQACAIKLQR